MSMAAVGLGCVCACAFESVAHEISWEFSLAGYTLDSSSSSNVRVGVKSNCYPG